MPRLTDPVRAVIAACVMLLLAAWLMLYGFSAPLPAHSPDQWVRQAP